MRNGGARRDRTADLVNAIHALSQLSYGPATGLMSYAFRAAQSRGRSRLSVIFASGGETRYVAATAKENAMGKLTGIFAAAATPLKADLSIDTDRLIGHCRWLLDEGGCDGVNLLGTTGEATSFSVEQRLDAMRAVAASGLPVERFMAGTGAAALSDALRLTSGARELGFAGALLLPPFYYKDIDDESLYAYVARVIEQAGGGGFGIYLYHFPRLSMVPYPIPVVQKLAAAFPGVLAGIKDSSGDFAHALALAENLPTIGVFPGSEAFLAKAPDAGFAGCISATTNINGALFARGWKARDTEAGRAALGAASAIREIASRLPVISSVKWVLAELQGDAEWRRVHPPLRGLTEAEWAGLRAQLAETGLFGAEG
jgi:4-hydroxy-tetrahydrodipicolinate synthase